MLRSPSKTTQSLFLTAAFCFVSLIASVSLVQANESKSQASDDDGFLLAWRISEVVLAEHINPPTRQEMFLSGSQAAYRRAGAALPADLSKTYSSIVAEDDYRELYRQMLDAGESSDVGREAVTEAFYEGMLHSVPGPLNRLSGEAYRVAESLRENRYVGIGIMLETHGDWPRIVKPFPGGPARIGGAKRMDLITSVDGVSTKGMGIGEVVDRLRGPLDSELTVGLKSGDEETRLVDMVRSQVPIASVEGIRENVENDTWEYVVDEDAAIGYIRMASITGSTAQEIRELARRFRAEKIEKVILDLRTTGPGDMHHVVLVADALLPGGEIGHVETRSGRQSFQARDEAVFVGHPMVVLTDERTSAAAEWLAAALVDSGRASVVGTRTRTHGFVLNEFELAEGRLGGTLGVIGAVPTGYYLRADGRMLTALFIPGATTPRMLAEAQPDPNTPRLANDSGVTPDVEIRNTVGTGMDQVVLKAIEFLQDELADAE